MSASPIWFGASERPLAGFLHAPSDGQARAGIVLCPPFGREYLLAHYALRVSAERLADLGFLVLRLDYDGTGDSAGSDRDPDRVDAWLDSVRAGIDLVRGTGVGRLLVAGMRIGATLAGMAAAADGGVDGLILWDPAVSGREYLAYQRALSAMSFAPATPRTDGGVETPGQVFDAATAKAMRRLDLTRVEGELAKRTLVLWRKDRDPAALKSRMDGPDVEWTEAVGQAKLLDVGAPLQQLPFEAIQRIAAWADRCVPSDRRPVTLPDPAGTGVVGHAPGGLAVHEAPIRIGPAGLYGVLTSCPGRDGGPVALFLNVANEHRMGPARLWVELARAWAPWGIRCVRMDLSGLGDSPVRREGQRSFVDRAPEAFDDVADAVAALAPGDPSKVLLVGLCSAGYQILESALTLRPGAVIALNPVMSFVPPETLTGQSVDPRRRLALPNGSVVQVFHGDQALSGLRRRFPDLGWKVRLIAHPRRRASWWLRRLVGQGSDVVLVCGDREARPLRLGCSTRTMARLRATGRFRFDHLPGLEHGLLISDQREDVADLVTRHVTGRYGHAPTAQEAPTDHQVSGG